MRRFLQLVLMALLAVSLGASAETVEVGKVKFPTQVDVGGQRLVLSGAGIRTKAIFKVYAAALYLKTPATTTEAVLSQAGPKRIDIHMLREVDGNELGKLFTKGMEANAPRDELARSVNGILKLSELFAARKALVEGDFFSVDYVPGVGSTVLLNGKPSGIDPIKEPEFFTALMRIWLGDKPADDDLKEGLLGLKKLRRSN
ncbi:chalcone isomerase family protein [Roseateles paludis]|jgi:hypothetical protein|uniref:Chalcone isomerase family protein n=1 Tax=Roseateles paludis TaxID=3145238 RepID=A0ABV0FW55_9BURK